MIAALRAFFTPGFLARIRAAFAVLFPPRVGSESFDSLPDPPPLVYFQDGVGYTQSPDYLEPWSEDKGQHDLIKIDLRLALWRYQHGLRSAGLVDVYAAGAAYRPDTRHVGALFPVSPDLSEGCRRLGYSRLVASTGLAVSATTEAEFWSDNEDAVRVFACEIYAKNSKTAQQWPIHMGKFAHDTEAQLIAGYTLGEPDGPTMPPERAAEGKTLAPLRVFAYTQATLPTFTPATATNERSSGPGSR